MVPKHIFVSECPAEGMSGPTHAKAGWSLALRIQKCPERPGDPHESRGAKENLEGPRVPARARWAQHCLTEACQDPTLALAQVHQDPSTVVGVAAPRASISFKRTLPWLRLAFACLPASLPVHTENFVEGVTLGTQQPCLSLHGAFPCWHVFPGAASLPFLIS